MTKYKKKREPVKVVSDKMGRPRVKPLPEPIPDTLENIARAVLNSRPKKKDEWRYLKNEED